MKWLSSSGMNMGRMVLFSIGYLEESAGIDQLTDGKGSLCKALAISEHSLSQYLSRSKREGSMKRLKARKGWIDFSLTAKGKSEYERTKSMIMDMFLVPGKHGVNRVVSVSSTLRYFNDPFEHIVLLKWYFSTGKKDIQSLMDRLRADRMEERDLIPLNEMTSIDRLKDPRSLEMVLKECSLAGIRTKKKRTLHDSIGSHLESDIIYADLARRRGHIEEALDIYEAVLSRKEGLGSALWTVSLLGALQCRRYNNKGREVISTIDKLVPLMEGPFQKALLRRLKADILSDEGKFAEASTHYRYCLKIFDRSEYPLLRCMVLNNLGVMYMRKGAKREAKKQWEDALSLVLYRHYSWSYAILLTNLSDVYGLEGNIEKAHHSLDIAERLFKTLGDDEGLSGLYFNKALVSIEEGEYQKVLGSVRSMSSYPLLYKNKIDERNNIIRERLEKKGALDIIPLIYPPAL